MHFGSNLKFTDVIKQHAPRKQPAACSPASATASAPLKAQAWYTEVVDSYERRRRAAARAARLQRLRTLSFHILIRPFLGALAVALCFVVYSYWTIAATEWAVFEGVDAPGGDLEVPTVCTRVAKACSLFTCQDSCIADESCRGFAYRRSLCYFRGGEL